MREREVVRMITGHGNLSALGAKKFFCGKQIGYGVYRHVYELKQDPNYVVKLQTAEGFDNLKEWIIWNELSYAEDLKKWFAPCIGINLTGTVLFQKRVEFREKKQYPKVLPSFFTDLKIENYGFIKNQLVCCDYGGVLLCSSLNAKNTRRARWWSDQDAIIKH